MSLETHLAENTAAAKELTAALTRVAENQERLIAGQEKAIEKIEAGKGAASRTTKKAESAPEKSTPEPAAEKKAAEETGVTDADVKAAATAWMNGKSKEQRAEAAEFIFAMLDEFGIDNRMLTGPESKLSAEQRKQALFYIQRKAAGLPVDFKADYDFDGDPTQGADEEDPLG